MIRPKDHQSLSEQDIHRRRSETGRDRAAGRAKHASYTIDDVITMTQGTAGQSSASGGVRAFAEAHGIDGERARKLEDDVSGILKQFDSQGDGTSPKLSMKVEEGVVIVDVLISMKDRALLFHSADGTTAPEWLGGLLEGADRVFMGRRGSEGMIRLLAYPRDKDCEGEPWFLGLSPALAGTLRIGRPKPDDVVDSAGTVVEDIGTGKVLRLDRVDGFLASGMDGKTKLKDLYLTAVEQFGLISPDILRKLYLALEENGMLAAGAGALPGRKRGKLRRLLEEGISFRKSDKLLGMLAEKLGILIGWPGGIILILMGLSGLVPLVTHGDRFLQVLHSTGPYALRHPWMLPVLYAFVFLTTIMHELGHGLTCKHFGGRVDRMGFMPYLVMLIFFCDVSSAWGMRSRRRRILVSLGGPLVTFGILGACMLGFLVSAGTGSGWEMFFAAAALMEALVLVMNLNPLLRMDAYYILEDILGESNLRRNSFRFWKRMAIRATGGRPSECGYGRRDRLIYLVYGLLGGGCTLLFILVPLYIYGRELLTGQGSEGKLVFAAFIVILVFARMGMNLSRTLAARTHWIREIARDYGSGEQVPET